jgi:hypothetical protein
MLQYPHDSDAESVLSHVSETSEEAETDAPAGAPDLTQSPSFFVPDTESDASAVRAARTPARAGAPDLTQSPSFFVPDTESDASAARAARTPARAATTSESLAASAATDLHAAACAAESPPTPAQTPTPPPAPPSNLHLTPLVVLPVSAPVAALGAAASGRSAQGCQDVYMDPELSTAALAFCAEEAPGSWGEDALQVESFESKTEARRVAAHADASAGNHAKTDAEGQPGREYLGMRTQGAPCHMENENREYVPSGFLHGQATDMIHGPKAVEPPDYAAPSDHVSRLPCLPDAPMPPTAAKIGGHRRRRRTELQALMPSPGVTDELLRGARVTDPSIVGPDPSRCQ